MIVASMLVSPLMGPIVAFTLGATICEGVLARGAGREPAGRQDLLAWYKRRGGWRCDNIRCWDRDWTDLWADLGPSADCLAHRGDGEPRCPALRPGRASGAGEDGYTLLIGLAFAVPSGVGVALAITGGGANSLVGVAIAASLLPPIINSGMCLAFWFAHYVFWNQEEDHEDHK